MNKNELKSKRTFDFNIGADPEFTILYKNQHLSAKELLTTIFDKKTKDNGLIRIGSLGYKVKEAGSFGWDGKKETGELRPHQEKTPEQLTNNIEELLKELAKGINNFEISSSSSKAPIGGHIHFELIKKLNIDSNIKVYKIHKKMSNYYFPLMLSENKVNMKIRNMSGYGNVNNYKTRIFETATTYEFRIPSAEWLTSKKIAKATIAYLGTVFHEITKNNHSYNKTTARTQEQIIALQNLVTSEFLELGKIFTNEIKKEVKTFEKYEEFKEEIDFILSPEKVIEEKEKINYNILKGWNIINNKNNENIITNSMIMQNNNYIETIKNEYKEITCNVCNKKFISKAENMPEERITNSFVNEPKLLLYYSCPFCGGVHINLLNIK